MYKNSHENPLKTFQVCNIHTDIDRPNSQLNKTLMRIFYKFRFPRDELLYIFHRHNTVISAR
jgi:hypothetical protein